MKKLIVALLLVLTSSVTLAAVAQGAVTVFTGPRWIVTNSTVAQSDLFYVGLESTSSNVVMLDFSLNAAASPRFSLYGDLGLLTRGAPSNAGFIAFSGYGYVFPNASSYIFSLHDSTGSTWFCTLDQTASGFCTVYTSANRNIGKVYFNWNP